MKRWVWLLASSLAYRSSALLAGSGAWNVDGDGVWSSGANWVGGAVAGGAGSTASFTNSVAARRTVVVDQPVTVEALRFGSPTNNNWRLSGEGPLSLEGASKPRIGSSVNQRVEIFVPLKGANGFVQESLPGDIELSGNNGWILGLGELKANTVVQTMSKTADDVSGVARNYFPTSGVILAGARFELLGRKNGSAVSSPWVLTAGSSAAQSSNASATSSLAPGQPVSGTGIPGGAFIHQILDGSNLVLSAVADQSITSTLSFAAASFRSEQFLQRVRTDSSQTLKVHKNGGTSFTVSVERVYGTANLALKDGDGMVTIPGQREHRGSIQLHSVDLTLAPKVVARQPAPGAAFHVDASQPDTLTLSGSEVVEWRDLTSNGLTARPPGPKPTVLSNELNGKPVVDFGKFGSNATSPCMYWYRDGVQTELQNIRAVFWVIGSQNGGGFLLGATNTAHFHRGNHPSGMAADAFEPIMASSYLWEHDWTGYPGESRVETYIDGLRRDRLAALSGGYQLISCIIATNVTAGAFATDRDRCANRRGGQRLAEVIVYERPLTELERIETEEYLMAKWFGDARWDLDGKEPYVKDLNAIGTRVLNAPGTGVTTVERLSGAGKLTKTGAGTLVVKDAQDYLGTLALAGGPLTVQATATPSAPASNAYFHVDASLTNTFVFDGNGRIAEWQDWRGNGRKALTMAGFLAPSLQAGASGGKPVVDFGALGSLQALQWNHTNTAIKAAFVVFHSLGATSPLLGAVTNQPQDFVRGVSGQLYNNDISSLASRAAAYGANFVNGWRIEPLTATLPSGICVVSVVPTTDARASAFAMDRHYSARSGGQRLAEVIIYNRALTDQERRDTEAYLMRKWLNRAAPGYGHAGTTLLPSVSFSGTSLNVEVAGSGVATIGQLTGYGSVVKSGEGTLAFGCDLGASGGDVRVSGGSVSAVASGDLAPADFPAFHVDASRTNTLTLAPENGTNFITRWASVGAVSNAAVERAGYKRPFVLTNDLAGLPTVGFGPYGAYNACLRWETAVSAIRSVFLVLGSQEGGGFILGAAGSCNFHRGPYNGVLNPVTTNSPMFGFDVSASVTGGAIYLDGARVASPTAQKLSGGYQLIEIQTTDITAADLFAADRAFTDRGGGQRLAEVIAYDRLLTESERRQTEAYLNKKWFGKSVAPSASFGTVALSDGAGLGASGMPVRVNRLEGLGTVVKSGNDTLTLTDTTAFTGTVDVAAGTLNLALPAAPLAPPSNTLFWVDASKAGSIDTDASGNVMTWRDATGNGRYATALSGHPPTLRSGDFTGRPVVDLGPYGGSSSSGSMLWNTRVSGMKTVVWVLGSQASGGYLLGATNGTSFHRGPPPEGGEIAVATFSCRNYLLSGTWGATLPTVAYTSGVPVNTTTSGLSGGYQVLFMTWSGGTYADGFAFDRNIGDRYGGQRLAEFIAYDRVLTDAERLAADAYLNGKWFGQNTPGFARPSTQTAVVLREGAVLAMNGTEQSVTALSGAGAVSNGTLVVTGVLSPGFAMGECVALSVTGGLTLGNGLTYEADYSRSSHDLVSVSGLLNVAGGGTLAARLPEPPGSGWAGRVAVATFGSITGEANLAAWTVTGLPSGYTGGLVVQDQTVFLDVRARGTLLFAQ